MKLNLSLWHSSAGRRVFVTFLLCSIIPLVLQAFLAEQWVERQLVDSAEERLAQSSRSAQMTLIENLQNIERSLVLFAAEVEGEGQLPSELTGHVQDNFSGFALGPLQGEASAVMGEFDTLPVLTPEQAAFVQAGNSQLCISTNEDNKKQILFARRLTPKGRAECVLYAQIKPDMFIGLPIAEAEVIVTDLSGRPLFSTIEQAALNTELGKLLAAESHGDKLRWTLYGEAYLGSCKLVFMQPQFHANWRVLYSQSEASILSPMSDFRLVFILVLTLTFWIVTLASLRQIRKVLHPLAELRAGTQRIAQYDFSQSVDVTTGDEFQELAQSFNSMGSRLDRHMAIDRELHAVGMSLGGENDSKRVMEIVLSSVLSLLKADTSCMFMQSDDDALRLERVKLTHQGAQLNLSVEDKGRIQEFSTVPPKSLASHCLAVSRTLRLENWHAEHSMDLEEERKFEASYGLSRKAIMAVALSDHDGESIGVLEVGRSGDAQHAEPFNEEDQRLFEALAAQTALALSKNKLISGFREMMMSMTEVFAMAVDEKSPYTGAHCRRVPEITMMLAESARSSNLGSLAQFQPTDEEFFELKVAALLHDCGKVVTPVHVMDKATKLETIHDRIALVDLRFEILQRDAHIALLEEHLGASAAPASPKTIGQALSESNAKLKADLEFLRFSNIGSERMPEEDRERVAAIGKQYSYRLMTGELVPLLDADELENLMIPWGTLTGSERKTINDHIVFTIRMLESLHYPKGLERVPLLAGAHHERMDGKGYPYGLTRDEIPVGGRIMGIADVFEALTDSDRPYKKGKTLQEALEILGKMADTGHLDQELFQLFMDDELYLPYARKYLSPERLTPVDLSRVRGYVPPSEHDPGSEQEQHKAA